MRMILKTLAVTLLAWMSWVVLAAPAYAHLMVAQHGTLNVVDDAVFMVLSLPVSAFEGVDENDDGEVSMIEFNHRRSAIESAVLQHVTLNDAQQHVALDAVLLSPVLVHNQQSQSLSQIVVMGRFALHDATSALQFHLGLYGTTRAEQLVEMTATRKYDQQRAVFALTPEASASLLFPDDKVWSL